MTTRPTSRPGFSTRLQGLLATVGILGIVGGMPLVLLAIGAEPIPQQLPDWANLDWASLDWASLKDDLLSRDDGTLALAVFKGVAWIAWLVMTVLIGLEVIYKAARIKARDLPVLGRPQGAARGLVAAAAMLFVTGPAIGTAIGPAIGPAIGSAPAMAATPTHTASTAAATTQRHDPAPNTHQAADPRPTFSYTVREGDNLWDLAQTFLDDGRRYSELVGLNRHIVGDNPGFLEPGWVLQIPGTLETGHETLAYVVQPGDTLADVAQRHFGDAARWPEIFQASVGITQPDGRHITNPDLILPGYTLRIPATDGQTATTPHATTTPAPRQRHAAQQHGHTAAEQTAPKDTAPDHAAPHDAVPAVPTQPAHPSTPAEPTAPANTGDAASDTSTDPAASDQAAGDQTAGNHTSILSAPWIVPSLAGGAVLSAALLITLRARRRRQFQVRRPGRGIALPPPDLARYEKTILVAGHPLEKSLEFLNTVLRQLALDIAATHEIAPPLAAVELTEESATLHLTEPADLPDPWIGSPDKLRWTATTSAEVAAGPHGAPAPFPLLATVGRDDQGHWWLLNLEHLGTITIGGDTERARDLLRYIACELALAPWADSARIDGVGIGSEAARMNSTRTRFHATDTGAADCVLASALHMIDRTGGLEVDTTTGRSTQVDDELWPARLLLVDAAPTDEADTDEASLARLIDLIADQPDRTGASVVLAGRDLAGGFAIDLTDDGRLRVAQAGLDLIPVGLTAEAADGSARVLEQSQDVTDVAIGVDETAVDGVDAYTDASGAIRREYTLPRNAQEINVQAITDQAITGHAEEEPARSMLEDDDQAYIEAAAVTGEDLEQVAPRIPARVCEAVEAVDPTLDEDFQAWVTPDPTRPRVRLLGNVKVTAYGDMGEVADRVGFYTELVAYLAAKSRYGATTDEVVQAFGYENRNRVRVDMTIVRSWLGNNPRTGQPFLPNATEAPAKREHGKNVYQLDTGPAGVIVDTSLFLRKKSRASVRGGDGMEDLRQALTLVDGVPYSRLRERGWSWLLEGDRDDEHMKVAVSDAAHILTTHYLKQGDLTDAFAVAKIGVLAAPDEDTMQLNLARVMNAQGRAEEAEKLLSDEVLNRSDDGLAPRDLSERTRKIISSWKATG